VTRIVTGPPLTPPAVAGDYIARMARKHSLFDRTDPAAEAAADARAERDAAEGRVIGHPAVRRWLASWGSGARLPRPRSGD
jgi:predicted transcriptional regulator